MKHTNTTAATKLFFLGFPGLGGFKYLLFILILSAYSVMMILDIVISIIVTIKRSLHSPMYFFLKHFLISEMLFVTATVPNMLNIIWLDGASIYVTNCLIQCYLSISSGTCECYLLVAMSYDRYLAICQPLHYHSIMDHTLQHFLVVFCWILSFMLILVTISFMVQLKFCDHSVIDNFFCDLGPLVDVACSDTSAVKIEILFMSTLILVIPFLLVIVSYMRICVTILRMPSVTGKKKAFSTCSSHLSVVGMFYGTLIINYILPTKGNSFVSNKMAMFFVLVVTPLFNPIIYSLRNQDMRAAINSYIQIQKLKL